MILVSACLAGFPCRWDGKTKPDERIIRLVMEGKAIPVCPEQLGGLTTPREPSEIRAGAVVSRSGRDVTSQFVLGANIVLELAKRYHCLEAILKSRSPSCGNVEVYDGSFSGTLVRGAGMTARLLMQHGITVRSEDDL